MRSNRKVVAVGAFLAAGIILTGSCSAAAQDGTFTASSPGFGGDVTVTITVEDGKLTDVTAVGDNETDGVGSNAIDKLPGAILEAGTWDVDGISGCTFSSNAVKEAAKKAMVEAGLQTEESAEVKMKPGTYTATAPGFSLARDIVAEVTVDETSIKDIVVDTYKNGETPPFMNPVNDVLVPRILENQSTKVDGITGATATSAGVKAAIDNALLQALAAGGSDESALEAFHEVPEDIGGTEEINTELLVIGMGGSGLSTSVSAAENGVDVLAIDKMARVGGTTMCTGTMLSVDPPEHEKKYNNGEDYVDKEEFRKVWLDYVDGKGKEDLINLMVDKSGEALDWADERGFDFMEYAGTGLDASAIWPVAIDWKIDKSNWNWYQYVENYLNNFAEKLTELGGKYMLETEAYDLITDENGTVVGAKARNLVTGTEYVIHAKVVALATGGFAGNGEMTTKYLSDEYYDLSGVWSVYGLKTNDGKMIQKAIDLGASTKYISAPPEVHNAATPQFLRGFERHEVKTDGGFGTFISKGGSIYWSEGDAPTYMVTSQKSLAVNKHGKRFTNEELVSMLNSWIAGPQYYSIWSTDQVEKLRTNGFTSTPIGPVSLYMGYQCAIPENTPIENIYDVLQAGMDAGFVFKADTLEELAQVSGIEDADALVKTVNDYNGFCENGEDTEFGKNPDFLDPIGDGPYYCIIGTPYCYTTCGGLEVDTDMQVLDEDGNKMPGLYAVGTDTMGVILAPDKAYPVFGGVANGWGITSGMTAGRAIAKELGK